MTAAHPRTPTPLGLARWRLPTERARRGPFAPHALAALVALSCACRETRERGDPQADTFASVEPLLQRACVGCHGESPAGGYRLSSYYDALGCTSAGVPATEPHDSRAPLIAVLARPDHAGLLSADERARLLAWVEAGTPKQRGSVHEPGILDPRSAAWHGLLAAPEQFAALRDPSAPHVCGRCHDASPVRPPEVQRGIEGAPACTNCHTAPQGVLDCSTCHGRAGHAYPPRDACYFGASPRAGMHAAHLEPSRVLGAPLPCAACHPAPGAALFEDSHGNGALELRFDPLLAGSEARFDASSGACAVRCHARGGSDPAPTWSSALTLDCNGCHLSPPPDHYPGACSRCHAEMGASADTLTPGPLHVNGVVDLGRGGERCGTCHGEGDEPWPTNALHRAHRDSALTTPIACESCHVVPATREAPGHMNGEIEVTFGGRALVPGRSARFDPATKTCQQVACHGAALQAPAPAPRWEPPTSGAEPCLRCHGAPPPPPHIQQALCAGGLCHGSEVVSDTRSYTITASGRGLHLSGAVEVGP